ncbi:MAG: hypothetical protein JW384_00058 [Nitrosomonadaceae bacterium]|nr:hypothetical protein [Nitrosomonadaceae bacterium]
MATAIIPSAASRWRRKCANPDLKSRIPAVTIPTDLARTSSCSVGPNSSRLRRSEHKADMKYPRAATATSIESAALSDSKCPSKERNPYPSPPPITIAMDPPVTAMAFDSINLVRSITRGRPADNPAKIRRLAPKEKSTTTTRSKSLLPRMVTNATRRRSKARMVFA